MLIFSNYFCTSFYGLLNYRIYSIVSRGLKSFSFHHVCGLSSRAAYIQGRFTFFLPSDLLLCRYGILSDAMSSTV